MSQEQRSKLINGYRHISYHQEYYTSEEMELRSKQYLDLLTKRRSVRHFSSEPVSKSIIRNIILSAGTAPSGAHKQPWKFCAVSSEAIKKKIRKAAEKEEKENYSGRMSESWLRDLAPLGTDDNKEFLEIAPWLIIVFKEIYEPGEGGEKHKNYYVNESVGIACGMLISAIQNAGLVTLTHTPSPMNFLTTVLNRPENERAFLLLPVGHPAQDAYVPDLQRKSLYDIAEFYE
ncbi:nitroreductase family protein [Christiangramia aquimixticola]|uniref:nitroreductase family protein n=1 Tax=Christiangramia aquimixticola TaxID=1697558 RepID=UPI003AA9185D